MSAIATAETNELRMSENLMQFMSFTGQSFAVGRLSNHAYG
jgi:hypothetical protein